MNYTKHTRCLLCNSDELRILKDYEQSYLVKCNACRFVFCSRIPTNEELISHYNSYKRNNYISPITIKRYNEILENLEKFRQTGNLLDIGCGDGYFLECAQKKGWKVYGTEYTDEAVKVCRSKSINISQGPLNAGNYNSMKFDVITSFEVIEHINNPQEEIYSIKSILRKGGGFYFTTPNFNSLSRMLLGPKWNVIEYPEHLSYYTPHTAHNFLVKSGFEKLFIKTSGIGLSRFSSSINTEASSTGNNPDEEFRKKAETKPLFKFIKFTANAFLALLGKGDNLKGLYRLNG